MKKINFKSKKVLIPLIAVPLIAGGTFAGIQLTAPPKPYTLEASSPPMDEGSNRVKGDIEDKNPRPQIVVPVGKGVSGAENPKIETSPDFYSPLKVPFLDDVSVNVGSGILLSSETMTEKSEVTAFLHPRGTANAAADVPLVVTVNKDTPEEDRNIAIPSNVTVGMYTLEVSEGDKKYSANITIIGNGDQTFTPASMAPATTK